MDPTSQIDAKLRAYLERKLSLQDLRSWFHGGAGTLLGLPEGSTGLELATMLQLVLIEHDKGSFTERQVKSHIRQALKAALEPAAGSSSK